MLATTELDYQLPDEAIATRPASPRDSAKLLVVRRDAGTLEHVLVRDLPDILNGGDLLVRNSTHVLPARFRGVRRDTGGKVEGLYLHDESGGPVLRCRVLLKMRRHSPGAVIDLLDRGGGLGATCMVLEARAAQGRPGDERSESGWIVRIESNGVAPENWLERVGLTPLPPYILAARRRSSLDVAESTDRAAYQTVFAHEPGDAESRPEHGSVAAPTAGLHFTGELLGRLESRGVRLADVVLHVGLGTFKPVETEYVEQHPMHTEWCMVTPEVPGAVETARASGARVVALGTTAARTLESFDSTDEMRARPACSTRLLITPGHRWRHVDTMLTNFHLPRSTLMAMVASLLPGGASQLRAIYAEAIGRGYRFYSFGDAMLVL